MQDSKRDTDVKNSLMDSVGEGEGGKIWENGNETCKISCRKRVASPDSMHDAGCLGNIDVVARTRRSRNNLTR